MNGKDSKGQPVSGGAGEAEGAGTADKAGSGSNNGNRCSSNANAGNNNKRRKKPRGPRSAFMIYCDANRKRLKADYVAGNFGEKRSGVGAKQIDQILSERWKSMDDNEASLYKKLAEIERERIFGRKQKFKMPEFRGVAARGGKGERDDAKETGQLLKIVVEYDGKKYAGYQTQPQNTGVQDAIEQAIYKTTGIFQRSRGCSRTDAGVHAMGQVISVRSESDPADFMKRVNSRLPSDIVFKHCEMAPKQDFHPRYSCKSKVYRYSIYNSEVRPVLNRSRLWHIPQLLNVKDMQKAANFLLGTHDFTSFCKPLARGESGSSSSSKSNNRSSSSKNNSSSSSSSSRGNSSINVRTIMSADFKIQQDCYKHDAQTLMFEIEGNSFLYNMVRIIVGALVQVGLGKLPPEKFKAILEAKDRSLAQAEADSAPAQGLALILVRY